MLRHWSGLVLFLDDGRLEMDTNVVERGMKGVAVARNYVQHSVMHSSLARCVVAARSHQSSLAQRAANCA
jgi:hypothetical protein